MVAQLVLLMLSPSLSRRGVAHYGTLLPREVLSFCDALNLRLFTMIMYVSGPLMPSAH